MIKSLYKFDGGEQLTMLTVGWFVSYGYFKNIDKGHLNWKEETYYQTKIVIYDGSIKFHKIWLIEILCMPSIQVYPKLNLTEEQIKCMVKKLLYKELNINTAKTPCTTSHQKMPKQLFDNNSKKIVKCYKNPAIRIFVHMGYNITHDNCNYAAKNTTQNSYWSNPPTTRLKEDWYLILDDYIKRTLYLFSIPYNVFKAIPSYASGNGTTELKVKGKNWDFLDLQITYNDPNFTDTRSNVSFKKYLVTRANY